MMVHGVDTEKLYSELRGRLQHIERLRRVVRCLTVVVYAVVLGWIVWGVTNTFWGGGFVVSEDSWMFVAGGFVGFLVLHGALLYSLTTLQEQETQLMRKVFRQLLPDAVYSAGGTISREILEQSALFELFAEDEQVADFTGYGSLVFRGENGSASIYDIGVTSGRMADFASRLPVVGALVQLYRLLVRPIFGAPIESSRHSFRGMFGTHVAPWNCRGRVLLLPDRLENKIGYLAHAIQSFRRRNGARHLILEDPTFEALFAVYADDEIEARKILTPAMMQRIVRVRHAFGRGLFLAFCGHTVYYAVSFPGGFLRPARRSLDDRNLFEQLVHEIELGRNLFSS